MNSAVTSPSAVIVPLSPVLDLSVHFSPGSSSVTLYVASAGIPSMVTDSPPFKVIVPLLEIFPSLDPL